MAYYQYYQSGGPWQNTWGTNAYQFQAPPVPSYVPQPSWGGADYYNAHYGGQSDSSLFDYVWGKVRNVVTGVSVSRGEAEHWHRRVYGGFVQLHQLMPRDIGAAAGWETLRLWQNHQSIYSNPLMGERGREREAVVGLAIAEAARLWQYVGRPLDKYGRREAGEVAAATASRIFMQMYDYDTPYDPYRSTRWESRDGYDRYDDDDGDYNPYTSRRRRSFSTYGGGSSYGTVAPYSGTTPIAIPGASPSYAGYAGSSYGMPGYGNNAYGMANSAGYGMANSAGYGMAGSPYYPNGGQYLSTSPYNVGNPISLPGSYGMTQPMMATSPGQVIIHTDSRSSRRRHRSSSRHHHHHRSRSNSSLGGQYVPTVSYSTGSYA